MSERFAKYGMVAPGLLIVLATALYPLITTFYLSFRNWNLGRSNESRALWTPSDGWSQIGYLFDNYTRALTDPAMWNSALITAKFTILSVVLTVALSLAVAVLLFRGGAVRAVLRSMLVLPFAMSPALIGALWRFMANADFGLAGAVNRALHLRSIDLLGSPAGAFWLVLSSDVWHWTPYFALIFIGALASVPKESQEAAQIDGASATQVFFSITLPQLTPVLAVAMVLKGIFAMKIFDQVVMITNGGPGQATQTLTHFIYFQGFKYLNMGYASALGWLLVIPMMILTVLYVRLTQRAR
ncbi:sugar ABC transporter permease [Caballeronia sp. LZ035]|uniref:carbohydrate ABC transporter permease n=1 Tax=Caballeronia sp. LZ035 TaxID=3038568 RepID=UPI0028671A13|nr:sugar ABC transporter permease [Caballeronia sp. LZ035]MDR5761035.1 sugar ABC transporter permease [Caballeronia sp. LZ035]